MIFADDIIVINKDIVSDTLSEKILHLPHRAALVYNKQFKNLKYSFLIKHICGKQ